MEEPNQGREIRTNWRRSIQDQSRRGGWMEGLGRQSLCLQSKGLSVVCRDVSLGKSLWLRRKVAIQKRVKDYRLQQMHVAPQSATRRVGTSDQSHAHLASTWILVRSFGEDRWHECSFGIRVARVVVRAFRGTPLDDSTDQSVDRPSAWRANSSPCAGNCRQRNAAAAGFRRPFQVCFRAKSLGQARQRVRSFSARVSTRNGTRAGEVV